MATTKYEATVCAEMGNDNGIFNCGDHATLDEAITACNKVIAAALDLHWADVRFGGEVVWSAPTYVRKS